MNYFKICLAVLGVFKSIAGNEEYPPRFESTPEGSYIRLSMRGTQGASSLHCPEDVKVNRKIQCSISPMQHANEENISCREPWSDSIKDGIQNFTTVLYNSTCHAIAHTFSVEFRPPKPEIDCPNYIDGTIYARKNATITCTCHLRDSGFPPGNVRWKKGSLFLTRPDLKLNIEDTQTIERYECEGSSVLVTHGVAITNIVALPENYPHITTEQAADASNYVVICNGTYPDVDLTLTCSNYTQSTGLQTTTLEISAERLKHDNLSCDCKVKMKNGLSFNSTRSIEVPDVTDDKDGDDNDDGKGEGDPDDNDKDSNEDSNEDEDEEDHELATSTVTVTETDAIMTTDAFYPTTSVTATTTSLSPSPTAPLPEISFKINGENQTLHIKEGQNMSIDCRVESPGRYKMTIQRDGDILVTKYYDKPYEHTVEATCHQSGQYTCMVTDHQTNVSNSQAVDVYVECAPVLKELDNVTKSYPPSNDSTVHVEVDVAGYPEPKEFNLLKEVEAARGKRSPDTESAVPRDRYNTSYERTSPGHGKAHLVMVGVSSNDTGKYIFVIKNGVGQGMKYRFRVEKKEEPVRIRRDLGVNVGALVGGVAAAVIVVVALIIIYIFIKKKDWYLKDDDEESNMDTKVEIHQFPPSPATDEKPVLVEDEIKDKTKED